MVGEFVIDSITEITKLNSRLGCYRFLKTYAERILDDKETVSLLERAYKINLKEYYNDYVIDFLYLPEEFEYMEKHLEPMPSDISTTYKKFLNKDYAAASDRARKLMSDCDNWLKSIGYYNEYGESNYKYIIEISNPVKYDVPLDLSEFELLNGNPIKNLRSWCYVKQKRTKLI